MSSEYHNQEGEQTENTGGQKHGDAGDGEELDVSRLYESPKRYTANEEILRLERELQEEGVELENPAIPFRDHPSLIKYPDDPDELRDFITEEVTSDNPSREKIGMMNRLLEDLEDPADE
jgi:hypothetical protein